MERPTWNEEMGMELAKIAANYLSVDTEDESAMKDIVEVLSYHHSDDGFQLGKEFEDLGYDVDMGIVEDLDCISDNAREILTRHTKEWVLTNNITLDLKPGDGVELRNAIQGEHYGIIYDLEPATARYGVRIEKLMKSPSSRYLIIKEGVTFVPPNSERPPSSTIATPAQ